METRKIGTLDVSVVGLGTNNLGGRLDAARSAAVVHATLDAGVNFIDTADGYGGSKSEQFIGEAIKGRRDEVVLATKFGIKVDDDHAGGAKPAYVVAAAEDSLRRLQTDRIELYILHRPDPETPIADTLDALGDLVRDGKVVEIGCSNFTLEQLREAEIAASQGAPRFVNLQNQYNLLQRGVEEDVLPECAKTGVGFVPYSPLAGGLLSGKYRRAEPLPEGTRIAGWSEERRDASLSDRNFDTLEALEEFCRESGHTLLDLAMSWLLAQSAVASVIAGATSPEQVRANVSAAQWQLSRSDLERVNEILAATA